MAPEIALSGLENLPKDYTVLDPMSGSGMVLGTAAKLGLSSIGYDLDPLACLVSRVNGTKIDDEKARKACDTLLSVCGQIEPDVVTLPWVDEETQSYMDFWFAPKQQAQLKVLSQCLVNQPFTSNRKLLDVLKVAVSRLIVTKEPKASLARDTAHSRPHRTILQNDFDVIGALPKSLDHVLRALDAERIRIDVKAYRGDARRIGRVRDATVDSIVTSPPYLNAIDYMRGHRLSLVWLGYSVAHLRSVRARSVGAEIVDNCEIDEEIQSFFAKLHDDVDQKKRKMLRRYYRDLRGLTNEAYRVLKPGRRATYVIGNSRIKGHEIANSELLTLAAQKVGFEIVEQTVRDIPENRRYMPLSNSEGTTLAKRMRTEHVLVFEKAHQ
ncbi:MAG: hypothetical protein AAGA74_14960 [Pseudomonadota bacterium]